MLRMPVATLRVWERRYALTQTPLSAGGQRRYSSADVQRLALLKQLTDLGHAIGSLAALGPSQLQRVASTHAHALAVTEPSERPAAAAAFPRPVRAWRVVVMGAALGSRLQRPTLLRRLGRPVVMLGPFDNPAQAAAEVQGLAVDAVLVHEPQLHAGWLAAFAAAAPALAQVPMAVLYGFAADPVCEALVAARVALLRDPQPDAVLAQWLHGFFVLADTAARATALAQPAPRLGLQPIEAVTPRRWDDAALADFAARSSTTACECPRHVAELLVQLSHFEAYSAECAHRSVADAELHAYLGQVAAASRLRFESALEQVALSEGLVLPRSAGRANLGLGGARAAGKGSEKYR